MHLIPYLLLTVLLVGCTTTSDPIDRLTTKFDRYGLWQNGLFPTLDLPESASIAQAVTRVFQRISFDQGKVTYHRISKVRQIQIPGSLPAVYTAVLVDTNLGKKIVLLKYEGPRVGWWSRVYNA